MLPVLKAAQVRQAETLTFERQGITSLELMERAARRCSQWLLDNEERWHLTGDSAEYAILCGPGNNGGDGLAIARLLAGSARRVHVVRPDSRTFSHDNRLNYSRLPGSVEHVDVDEVEGLLKGRRVVLVDALFGTGLNRPLEGSWVGLISKVNRAPRPTVSIDMPSGAHSDGLTWVEAPMICADVTLGLGCFKPTYLFREFGTTIGQLEVLDIGLELDAFRDVSDAYHLSEKQDIEIILPEWRKHSHKGDHGHAGLVAGALGMVGAAVLATRAALRSGTGLVTAIVPVEARQTLHASAPEALVGSQEDELGTRFTALGIGPGLGPGRTDYLRRLIRAHDGQLVLDADALNMLAVDRGALDLVRPGAVLTPHPKEFDRLFGSHGNSAERVERARQEASARGWVIVLKGAYTAVCPPSGAVHFNPSGDPGMAKGGSGDVLTGLLTGLLARGMAPFDAARAGVWVHGRAGSIAADRIGREGMTANDLVDHLPNAWRELRGQASE